MENKNSHSVGHSKKGGGSAFFWGVVVGALLASLLVTKSGRRILRELSEVAMDLIENFIEERTQAKNSRSSEQKKAAADDVRQDIESEITEVEEDLSFKKEPEIMREEDDDDEELIQEATPAASTVKKKRLFRGLRRKVN